MLDAGCWMLDTGCWILDAGYWILDAGFWMLDARCWMLGRGGVNGYSLTVLEIRKQSPEEGGRKMPSKVLIVDDNQDNLYALSQRLGSQKIIPLCAENGSKALLLAKEEHPDVILLDIQMPQMDGFETCRLLKDDQSTRFIPIIFLTAKHYEVSDRVKGLDLGAHDYLTQPCDPEELMARVRGALREKEIHDQFRSIIFQKEKLANIGKLTTSIAHEINNPLSIIVNVFDLIKEDVGDRRCMELAEKQIDKIQRLAEQLLNFHRPCHLEKSLLNLNSLLLESLELMSARLKKGSVHLVSQLDERLPSLLICYQQMSLVFLNLIINACEAMLNGGLLTVGSKHQGNLIRIWVRDTGPGIPQENLKKIFEPFFTTKENGTGIGLFLVSTLVDLNGGRVEVKSTPGEGTEFIITFSLLSQ